MTLKGVSVTPLYIDDFEEVSIQDWDANTQIELDATLGAEIFVLTGEIEENGELLGKHSWLRLPAGSQLRATSGSLGARVWIKQNHLGAVAEQTERVNKHG